MNDEVSTNTAPTTEISAKDREWALHSIQKRHARETSEKRRQYSQVYYQKNKENILNKQHQRNVKHKTEISKRSRLYQNTHKTEKKEYMQQYEHEHANEREQYRTKYRQEHKKERKQYNKERYQKHREEILRRAHQYNATHKKEIAECNQRYYTEHPEVAAKARHNRRALLSKADGTLTREDVKQCFERHGNACFYCGSTESLTIDHMTPLTRGGANSPDNIVPACKTCNRMKKASTAEEFFERLRRETELDD